MLRAALWRPREENLECEAGLGHILIACLSQEEKLLSLPLDSESLARQDGENPRGLAGVNVPSGPSSFRLSCY